MTAYKNHIIAAIIISLFVILAYWNLPQEHFIGDEWVMISKTMYLQSSKTFSLDIFKSYTHHFWPLYYLSSTFQYRLFGLNPQFYAMAAMLQHCLVSILVYYVCLIAIKNFKIAIASGLIFALNSSMSEMVTSVAVYPNHGTGTVFLLLCLIFFLKKLQAKDKKLIRRFYFISLIMLFISLLFGEWAIFLAILLPVWTFIYEKFNLKTLKKQLPVLAVVLAFLLLRTACTLSQDPGFTVKRLEINSSGKLVDVEELTRVKREKSEYTGDKDILRIGYKLVNYPSKVLAQEYLPRKTITNLAARVLLLFNPDFSNNLKDTIFLDRFAGDYLSIGLSFLFVILVLIAAGKDRRTLDSRIILLFLSFTAFSVLPYVITGEVHTFLQSRYYYHPAIGSSILLACIIFYLCELIAARMKVSLHRIDIVYPVAAIFIFPVLILHFSAIRDEVNERIKISNIRTRILDSILNSYPTVGEKSIFYTESSKQYFGLDEYLMPFDCGFGHILLTEYHHNKGLFNREFFKMAGYFRDLNGEGYFEFENSGFGYFRHIDRVLDALEKNNLTSSNVYSFRYDGESNTIYDITEEVRDKINSYKKNVCIYISKNEPSFNCKWIKPDDIGSSNISFDYIPVKIKQINCKLDGKDMKGVYFEGKFGNDVQRLPVPFIYRVKAGDVARVDRLYSAGTFRHRGWVGPLLIHYVLGNETNVYKLPSKLYDWSIVNIHSVTDLHSGEVLTPKNIRKTKKGEWIVTLPKAYSSQYALEFRVYLSALQLDLDSKKHSIDRITKTEILTAVGNGEDETLVLSSHGGLISGISTFKKRDLSLKDVAYIDGEMRDIVKLHDNGLSNFKITFDEPPPKGALVEVPVLADCFLEDNENIAIVYDGYLSKLQNE